MAARWIELVTGSLEEKRRYRKYKARVKTLPAEHRISIEALDRFLMYRGGIAKGDVMVQMLEELADLFEQGAADGTSVRDIVGDDPVEFAETFLANYADAEWIEKERIRLKDAIERATTQAKDAD